jgi:tellurite resistance protein TehA-like permease
VAEGHRARPRAACAAVSLPIQWPGLRGFATVCWLLAATWLTTLTAASAVRWTRRRTAASGDVKDPVIVQFYGAPPMAALTVGAGTLLLGAPLIGTHAAVRIDAVLWILGTVAGLASALAVPYLLITRVRTGPAEVFADG